MSHLKARKEKECLNCNAIVYGRYCHVCGQENVEPKETFLHLLRHFIEDITHFDGKFFDTLKYLLLRPGFLSYEYMRGRRHSYLNPIRMYVFTSAIFFLIYFSVHKTNSENETDNNGKGLTVTEHKENENDTAIHKSAKVHESEQPKDSNAGSEKVGRYRYKSSSSSLPEEEIADTLNNIYQAIKDSINTTNDLKQKQAFEKKLKRLKSIEKISGGFIQFDDEKNADTLKKKGFKVKTKSRKKAKDFFENIFGTSEERSHTIPKVMFVTLPLMALVLQFLYRKLKQFYYVNHAIFILHLYVAIYLILLIDMGMDYLHESTGWGIFSFLSGLSGIGAFFYTYKAIRNFYLQGRGKSFFKCFALYIFFTIIAVLSLSAVNYISSFNSQH